MKNKPVLIALAVLFSLLLAALFYVTSNAAGPLTGTIVCLDPGHGGSDPGAVNSAFNLRESAINLDVSFGLKALLEEQGAVVVMTRTTDDPLLSWSNSDRYTFCNAQAATILVSVHTNSVTDPTWDGSLALYGPKKSPDLAQAIYDVMFPALAATKPAGVSDFRDFGLDRFASGVLFKSDMPAAMMEPLFMSHPAEAELLVEPIFSDGPAGIFNPTCSEYSCRRGQIAEAIFLGILNYFDAQPGGDNPPTVTISSPTSSTPYLSGEPVPFAGSAADNEDGDLTADLVWTSDVDGAVGTGGSFSAVLSDGPHLISATVTDSAGQTASATVNITVGSSGDFNLSAAGYKIRGEKYADLTWSGTTAVEVDIFRDGSQIATTANDGLFSDGPLGKGGGSASYQVCEAGTTTCSNTAVVSW